MTDIYEQAALRSWQEKARGLGPFRVPAYEDFTAIVQEHEAMAKELARVKAKLEAAEYLVHALNWCGGSDDFQEGGKARVGWERVVQPALAAYRTAGETNDQGG